MGHYFVFSLIFNCINCNHHLSIVLVIFSIVKMPIISIMSIDFSISLICFNTDYFVSRWYYICFISSLSLLIQQSLLWKLDLIGCFIFSDWSFILLNGNFVQILFWTVVCFVSLRVLLFPQIEIGFKIIIYNILLNYIKYIDIYWHILKILKCIDIYWNILMYIAVYCFN